MSEDELLASPSEEKKPFPETHPDVPDIKIKRIISGKNNKATMHQITHELTVKF